MMAALLQSRYAPLPDWEQAVLLFAVSEGFADTVDPSDMESWGTYLINHLEIRFPALVEILRSGKKLEDSEKDLLREAIGTYGSGSEVD